MHTKRMLFSLPLLLLVGVVLAACGGVGFGGSGTSPAEDVDDAEAEAGDDRAEADRDGTDEAAGDDDPSDAEAADAGQAGPSGSVTIDGVTYVLEQIVRCVPTDQTTQRIEAVDGIDSLETLNLVANGDPGRFEMYYTDAGVRTVNLRWNGDGGSLDGTYAQVVAGADWIAENGERADGEPLQVVAGVAVGGAMIDGRHVSFELPIPVEPSC